VKKPAIQPVFSFPRNGKMRTACFVDGYNLYYGMLQGTAYKWLDLPALLSQVLHVQNPAHVLAETHYFTAPVKPDLATRGLISQHAQHSYLRALAARDVKITLGRHRLERGRAPIYIAGEKASRTVQADIWQLEEKETDVSIAISMYRTAMHHSRALGTERIQQLVLVSADTDMTPALVAIRQDFPEIRIGVILPHREGIQRGTPGSLANHSHWIRRHIRHEELAACQFPRRVGTKKKPADKPSYW
jgi:uncharacterized LabA/DUF88 family protein